MRRARTPSVKPKPRPVAEQSKPQEFSKTTGAPVSDLVPAAVIGDSFAALSHLLADVKSYYESQTNMIARRLDEVDRAITNLENQ
jgi:hypothetical protein